MRLLGMTSGVILSLLAGGQALSAPHSLSQAETKVCKSVKHCADILARHSSEDFDYRVLHGEFMRLGPGGVGTLFRMMSSKDDAKVARAQNVLAQGRVTYSPQDQAKLAALWPRADIDAHAKIMRSNLSPLILSRAIETLSHNIEQVRNLSRDLIDAAVQSKTAYALTQTDISRLSKAAITAPTPGLITLLKSAPTDISKPVFTRILRSGDAPSVIAAYDSLFAQDPKIAFETLLGTLYDLKDDEGGAALALGALLRHRHKGRPDGFYLNFAKDIANDPKMSAMGRMAGFDAVMGSADNKTVLANTPVMVENLKASLAAYSDVPPSYARNFYLSAKDEAVPWINAIWAVLKSDPYKNPETTDAFFGHLGKLSTPEAKSIVSDALRDKRDFGMIILGLKAAVRQKDKSRIGPIKTLLTHPVSDVRIASAAAITALQKGLTSISPQSLAKDISTLNRSAKLCRAIPKNFKAETNQLPFFDLESAVITTKAPLRSLVQSIAPTTAGWLVGYASDHSGGDLQFYDNKTGRAIPVLYPKGKPSQSAHNQVRAIFPTTPQPLGQYASEFWAIMTHNGPSNSSAIYRISKAETGFRLRRHAQLPSQHVQISPQPNSDIFISFFEGSNYSGAVHPPLILSKDGRLRRACDGPQAEPPKALP